MSKSRRRKAEGQILVFAALLLAFLFIPLAVFVVDTGLVEAGYAQLTETVQAAAEDGASALDASQYRASHAQVIELDPVQARDIAGQALVASRLPGLESWHIDVRGRTVTVTARLRVQLLALGSATLKTTKSARLAYGQ